MSYLPKKIVCFLDCQREPNMSLQLVLIFNASVMGFISPFIVYVPALFGGLQISLSSLKSITWNSLSLDAESKSHTWVLGR
jgi:hypothetical protein